MSQITYLVGDATQPIGSGRKIIAHVCNDIGLFGAGFALAVANKWPGVKKDYQSLFEKENGASLGTVQYVVLDQRLIVANMIAQHKVRSRKNPKPIDYAALAVTLQDLARMALLKRASVHMPKIGSGLAGGDWRIIEKLISDKLCRSELGVYVYSLNSL